MSNTNINVNNEQNSSKQIKAGAIMSYIGIVFNVIAGLIFTPWMVKQIGQSDYGLYTLAISVISFVAMDFGLGAAVSRFISKYHAEEKKEKINDFLGITYKLYLIISLIILVVLIIVFLFIENIFVELTIAELFKLKVVFCIAGLYSVTSFSFTPLNGILISHEKFIFLKLCDLISKVLTILLMAIALLMGYNLYSLVIVNAIVGIILIALKLYYIKQTTSIKTNYKSKNITLLKEIFGFSAWTSIIGIAQRFILNITPSVLGAFSGSAQIAIFSIAMTIEGYLWTFANALNGLFLPKVTRMTMNNENTKDIENLMIKVGRIQLIIIGLIIIGFLTMGKQFMILWMGENFKESYYVAMLLIVPSIISLTQEIAYTMLIAVNEIKYRALASVGTAVVSIVLSILFASKYGAIGSAFAIFIGNFIGQIIIMNIVYYKVLKINIFRFFKECHLKMCLPLIFTTTIGFVLQKYIPASNLFFFMFKSAILAIIYVVFMWIMALNKYEKGLFTGTITKVSQKLKRNFS